MQAIWTSLQKIGLRLARPDILFWVLPLMMALLILGTVAQKNIGLYAAQEEYFGSFYTWIGPKTFTIPIPAGLTIMGIFLVNLTCKFLFRSEWSWQRSGSILSHFGVLLLVFGGVMTALTSQEGFLMVGQGDQSNIVEDYHSRNLVVYDTEGRPFVTIPHENLHDALRIELPTMPVTLTIDKYCFNCSISMRPQSEQEGWHSPGNRMMLNKAPADSTDEKNLTGIEFTINGAKDEDINGKYLTFVGFPKPPVLDIDDEQTITIELERAKRPLPFAVKLIRFERDMHPGTDMASAYTSWIKIIDEETGNNFPAKIEMNEPLRYRGFTLYQSSFDLNGDKPHTVLAVVNNKGRIFPYLASLIIALGLIIHLVIRLTGLKKSTHKEEAAR
ncbi:MAG TPA: cytochrome c biogenesis protein ResB [Alphaproteobacteria bacterium]|nr:cytochrome c biogenesis protein ResB [Alphaproteobacteria bacterium]HOO50439.1 cytochrome c biogenesis protein ResB [Alphaproteobacteria bacterium]